MNVIDMTKIDEGFEARPYLDSRGYLTVGFGCKLSNLKGLNAGDYCINLEEKVAEAWLISHIDTTINEMNMRQQTKLALFAVRDFPARHAALVNMAFQMGTRKLATFKKTLGAVIANNWVLASDEMVSSRWYRQTPNRASRMVSQMLTGEWHQYYLNEEKKNAEE